MNATATDPLPLDAFRSAAQPLLAGPRAAEARQLLKLIDLYAALQRKARGPHGELAEGLAAAVLPAVEAAAARLGLGRE